MKGEGESTRRTSLVNASLSEIIPRKGNQSARNLGYPKEKIEVSQNCPLTLQNVEVFFIHIV